MSSTKKKRRDPLEELAEIERQRVQRELLERRQRDDGSVWGPETSEDDPYGEKDEEYEGLE